MKNDLNMNMSLLVSEKLNESNVHASQTKIMNRKIKKAYICRQVISWGIRKEIPVHYQPRAGDVGFFEILSIGKHRHVQGESKRNISLIEGDIIMAAFGNRYATGQFEGYVPDKISGDLDILGGGGTVGVVTTLHKNYEDIGPTKIRLVALAVDTDDSVINTKKVMQKELKPFTGIAAATTKVVLSLGSSMDSGKTTTAAYMVHGLKKAGFNVAYIKLTGTVYSKDTDLAWDMGADAVADFADYGFPSTYLCTEEELLSLYETLVSKSLNVRPDYVIIEIADGLYQQETKMLLTNSRFISTIDSVVFSAGDSLSAVNGVQLLSQWGIHTLFISGLLTASPLLLKEVQAYTNVPVLTIEELAKDPRALTILTRSHVLASNG